MHLYLKFIISLHIRLQKLLTDTKEEAETLVKNYSSPSKLATFVVAMKRCINSTYIVYTYIVHMYNVHTVLCRIQAQYFGVLALSKVL